MGGMCGCHATLTLRFEGLRCGWQVRVAGESVGEGVRVWGCHVRVSDGGVG